VKLVYELRFDRSLLIDQWLGTVQHVRAKLRIHHPSSTLFRSCRLYVSFCNFLLRRRTRAAVTRIPAKLEELKEVYRVRGEFR